MDYKEVNEAFSTVTCSVCFERTGPSGPSAPILKLGEMEHLLSDGQKYLMR